MSRIFLPCSTRTRSIAPRLPPASPIARASSAKAPGRSSRWTRSVALNDADGRGELTVVIVVTGEEGRGEVLGRVLELHVFGDSPRERGQSCFQLDHVCAGKDALHLGDGLSLQQLNRSRSRIVERVVADTPDDRGAFDLVPRHLEARDALPKCERDRDTAAGTESRALDKEPARRLKGQAVVDDTGADRAVARGAYLSRLRKRARR